MNLTIVIASQARQLRLRGFVIADLIRNPCSTGPWIPDRSPG